MVAFGPTAAVRVLTPGFGGAGGAGGGGCGKVAVPTANWPNIEVRVRVALEAVDPVGERDRPRHGADLFDLGAHVDAGAGQVEVVLDGLVVHGDLVRADRQVRDVRAARIPKRDREAGPDRRVQPVACAQAALGSRTATTATVAMQSARIRWLKPSPSESMAADVGTTADRVGLRDESP